jgi:autotransporter-associated beta strand protein
MKLCSLPLLLPAMAWGVATAEAADPKPNIVFIMADDLGWRDLGVTGSKFYQTPNIDRLARKGMLFTDAYAANPLCSPTRAGVLTGLHPQRTGFTAAGGHLPQEVFAASVAPVAQPWARGQNVRSATRLETRFTTYAELLREAGYRTAHFGKWHVGSSPYMATNHGFDVDIPAWNVPGPAGGYLYPWNMAGYPELPGEPGEHLEERMGREVAAFIRENKDRPFFVNYWAFTPHSPYQARPDLVEKHRGRVDRLDPQQSATMAAMIESLDNSVGTVLAALEEAGVAGRTVIVLTSDNGGSAFGESDGVLPTSNAPLKAGKGTIYEGGIRVPFIVDWPGVTTPGSTSTALVQTTDLFPTFLAMAGVPLPADYPGDGASIAPLLAGDKTTVRDAVYTYFPQNVDATGSLSGAAVRRGNDKLIRYFAENPDGSDRLELYDLSADPGETRNLAAEKPALAAELNDLLGAYLHETAAPIPGMNPAYDTNAPRPWEVDALHGRLPEDGPKVANGSFETPALTGDVSSLTPPINGWGTASAAMSGGILKTGYRGAANFIVGYEATASLTQSNGMVDVGSLASAVVGWNAGGAGVYTLAGGSFTASSNNTYIGWSNGTGTVNVDRGSFTAHNLNVGGSNATGTLNLNGGSFTNTGTFNVGAGGTVNVNSGGSLRGGAGGNVNVANDGVVNFKGGIGHGSMNLRLNGGTVDVQGQAMGPGSWANLVANGTGATLKNSSTNAATIAAGNTLWIWRAATNLTIHTVGDLQIDSWITSSGQTIPTGLIKTGPGTLVLTDPANNYTGNTTVAEGTLELSSSGSLVFAVGSNGVNSRLQGSGTVVIDGTFNFNLANASTNNGDRWTIVDPSLGVFYGETFFVNGFNGSGGIWTRETNGVTYRFEQSTGLLSASSETPGFGGWLQQYGLSGAAADPLATPAGDGIPNLLKYAFNLDPLRQEATGQYPGEYRGLPYVTASGSAYFEMIYYRDPAKTDIRVIPVWSAQLENASGWNEASDKELLGTRDGIEAWRARLPMDEERGFLRIRVEAD